MGISQICSRHERNLRPDSDRKHSNARRAPRFYGRRKPPICWHRSFYRGAVTRLDRTSSCPVSARDSLRRDFLTVAEARKILARDPTWSERPRGKYVVEPVFEQKTIITAELDLNAVDREKMTLDVSGHYSRANVSDFRISPEKRSDLSKPGIELLRKCLNI